MRLLSLLAIFALPLAVAAQPPKATPGNRLAYLDDVDPYYPHARFPKLITPQWVGEPDVDAVVILAIDDMRDPKKYEAFLRPILNRLKKIDGRAPVSIMTCKVEPSDPQLQSWLKEGLSLEVHTVDHPCPYFKPGFEKAKDTYDRCVDLMNAIPNNKPVCFRMPCCDSMNTPSPRHWAEIFNQTTAKWNYLSLDSSVFMVYTSDDPELPKELVLEDGKERFTKYLPMDREFVNWIENYPYPYVIGKYCWQFPCMTPSDWEAQHLHKSNNPLTVRDWKAALDCTVIKKGVFNMVFHPHGWIKAEQIIELIDHAVEKHGKKVKFLTFKEAHDRLQTTFFPKWTWDGAVRYLHLLDVNNDGYLDFVNTLHREGSEVYLWQPDKRAWKPTPFGAPIEYPLHWHAGVLQKSGHPSLLSRSRVRPNMVGGPIVSFHGMSHFDGKKWSSDDGIRPDGGAIFRLLDLDGDGICELIDTQGKIFAFEAGKDWKALPFVVPTADLASVRFLDLNGDGKLDLVFSNEKEYGVYLFMDMKTGWKKLRAGKAGDANAIPMLARNGKNNGCWAHSGQLWWANEDTAILKNNVDRRSYKELLEAK